jgi:acyl-[acyl-carrier-protein]-phospholipid O-acyltransferase/long-chain-fatty-acid--[acyl-carrier-protein] ligase
MRLPLFFQRRFLPMWTALSLGAFADNLLRQALIIGVAFGWIRTQGLAEAADAIPVIGSIFAVSMLIFSSIAGQVAEKFETQFLFRWTKFVEVVLMSLAAAGFLLNEGWLLIATLFAMAAQSAFFAPVRQGAMRKYLHADELVRGNGLANAGLYGAIVAGLFFGGLLIPGENGRAVVAACLFAAALSGWLAVLAAPKAAAAAPDLKLGFNVLREGRRILTRAFAARGVARPILGWSFFFYLSTLMTVALPLYARDSLGADEFAATLLMGAIGVGAGAGGVGAAALSKTGSGLVFSTFGIAGASAATLAAYLLTPAAAAEIAAGRGLAEAPAGAFLLASFVAASVLMGLFVAPLQAAVQRRAPAGECARIVAAGNMMNAAFAMAGSLSVLAITRTDLGPETAFVFVAALQAGVALYMFRRRRRVAAGLYDEILAPAASVENQAAARLPAAEAG